jgi:hypothetical protein
MKTLVKDLKVNDKVIYCGDEFQVIYINYTDREVVLSDTNDNIQVVSFFEFVVRSKDHFWDSLNTIFP